MLTAKVFHRKTKKGSVIKVVREHYLRDDIHCGKDSCRSCRKIEDAFAKQNPVRYLDDKPRKNLSTLCREPHYVVPDVDVLIHQIDVLEDDDFGNNVIILQTALNEVRRKNIAIFSRIKDLIRSRGFHVFVNEFHRDAFTERLENESLKGYANRLVRSSVLWYQNHLQPKVSVVFLVATEASKALAGSVKHCYTFNEYITSMKDPKNLIEKLAQLEDAGNAEEASKFLYPEYLPLSKVQSGLKTGKYHQGKLQMNRDNYLEGFVNVSIKGEDVMVLIQGRENLNRAIQEDICAIELLPREKWSKPMDVVLLEDDVDENTEESKLIKPEPKAADIKPTGKVVAIIKRNWRQYCGSLRERGAISKSVIVTSHYFVPSERRIPIIKIETRQYEILKNQRIVVAIDSWPRDSKFPRGHYVRALGEIGDDATEKEVLLLEYDIPYTKFTPAVLNCLPNPDTWKIPFEEYSSRVDLRDEYVCSIDPPGCTDIDDALHCKNLGGDKYEIGVHIADVSYFVKTNSALDLEAAKRGTTVYLVKNRIDMIPTVLSSNLCSLMADQERLTFSVIWVINKKTAEILDTKFVKSVIKSRAAFTYAEAQLRIDSRDTKDELTEGLRRLNKIAKILKKKRLDAGALVLNNFGELKFVEIETESHDNVTQIETKKMLETNSLVEEFMLLANVSVAEKIYEQFPELALLRRHPKPSATNLQELVRAAEVRGFKIDTSSNKGLNESLEAAMDPKNQYLNPMLRMIAVRCMTQAQYFCSGKFASDEENFAHYGLAAKIYTHFTSPIRRYADLIVHRQLAHVINASNLDPALLSRENVQKICENINYRYRNAHYANAAAVELETKRFIKNNKEPVKEEGYVLYVKKNALDIFLPHLVYSIKYFLDPLTDWDFDETNQTQLHIPSNITFRRFDSVKIEVGLLDLSTEFRRGFEKIYVKIIDPDIGVDNSGVRRKKLKT